MLLVYYNYDRSNKNSSFILQENSLRCTPKKIANMKYREIRDNEQRNRYRERITVIQALMATNEWRRGLICSNSITAKVF